MDKVDLNRLTELKEPLACFITRTELNLIPAPKESTIMEIRWFDYNPLIQPNIWTITVNNHDYTRSPDNDAEWTPYPYAWERADWQIIYTNNLQPTTWNAYEDFQWTTLAWTIDAYDVEITDKEENIFIDKRWHYIIVEWLKYRMYGNMWVNFETARNNSRAFYDNEKIKAIQNIVDRWQLADTAYFPDLNFLNY